MLARWITTRITLPLVAGAIAVPLMIAGWQNLEARQLRGQLGDAQRALATERTAAATLRATVATLRTTLATERTAQAGELAACEANARDEAARQFRAGQATAGLSRHCVHDRGPAAVNRALRDVLGESQK